MKFLGVLPAYLLAAACFAQPVPGTINTVAGSNAQGFSGDGGPATSAALNQPPFVAIDPSGNLYIADAGNNRIRKVDGLGIITTFAGNGTAGFSGDGGPATAASLNNPIGVNFDAAGNLYIADTPNERVRKVDTAGVITTIAGNGAAGFSGDGGPATAAAFYNPVRTIADNAGNVYVADQSNHRVRRIDAATGIITTVAGNGAGNPQNGAFSGDGGPATQASLNNPTALALDAAGNLYLSDQFNQRVRKVDTNGIITTVAGNGTQGFLGDGGPATSAQLNYPGGLAIDSAGNLYINDDLNYKVRVVSSSGVITTVAGSGMRGFSGEGGPAIAAAFNGNFGLALDSAGNLYIADSGNNRIRRVAGLSTAPYFTIASITNAASFESGISPGGIAAIFGTNLSHNLNGILGTQQIPLPTTLGGVSVTVGGIAAPLFAVANLNGTEQINVQIPWEIAGQSSVPVVVNNGLISALVNVPVLQTQPGVFLVNGTAAALHGVGLAPITAASPAAKGEIVVLYATGLGAVSPPVLSGAPAPFSPLSYTATASVTVGGMPATVQFSGLTPGLVALDQLNVQLPTNLPSGNADVVVTVNGVAGKAAPLPVQ